MKLETNDRNLTVYLDGEIDHHSAMDIRNEIDKRIDMDLPAMIYLDFSAVTFMDSSGIGLVMGRYKKMSEIGGGVAIANPPRQIKKVMQLSGLDKIAKIVNKE